MSDPKKEQFEEEPFEDEPVRSEGRKHKSKTPVLDNFSISFSSIFDKDAENCLEYYHRENEENTLLKTLLKKEKPHIAIIGEPGTGRESLIKATAKLIMRGDAGFILDKLNFFELEFESIIAGTKYRGQFEERVKAIGNEIEKNDNIVLYIKDLNVPSEYNAQILTLFKTKGRIITIFTSEIAEDFFKRNGFLYPLFNIIKISPTTKKETTEILKKHVVKFQKSYSIEIKEDIIDDVIDYSNLYLPDELQPQKSISILEEVCATVELSRLSNPSDVLHELKKNYDALKHDLDNIIVEKTKIVKLQKYEEAARLRDTEKNLLEKIEVLRTEMEVKGKEIRVRITKNDLIDAIHNQTGIEKQKIKNKEKIIVKTKQSIRTEYSGLPQFEFLQTQSILHGHQISIKGGVAFVLIPHNKEYDDLFNHYIKPAMEIHGLTVLKADNIFKPGNILSQVWAQIRTAEVIIADVSGQNSNVIFELGLCYGIQRCPILLTRDPSELPFNIRNLRYIQYENTAAGAHKLGEDIKTTVGEFLSAVRTDNF